jgi:hypothetical protein
MAKFTDANGNEWIIKIDPVLVDEVYAETKAGNPEGLSLYKLLDGGFENFRELLENIPLLLNVVHLLIREQAQAKGIDTPNFLRGMNGDAIEAASEALYDALVEFAPKKKRELMASLKTEAKALAEPLLSKASDKAMMILRKQFGKLSDKLDSLQEDSL